MRAKEFTEAKRKPKEPGVGDTTPHDYNPGWESLNWLKERGARAGNNMAGAYQLFVPRKNSRASTPRDRRMKNLADKYAWDDNNPSELKPQYAKWEEPPKELKGTEPMGEAAPILKPGKAVTPPGSNKPQADLWTSTARQAGRAWTSEWAEYAYRTNPEWFSDTGYLYRVKPGALILELNTDQDAEEIYRAFTNLGSAAPIDYEKPYGRLTSAFPWDQIAKHFDGVRHYYRRGAEGFMYGWDVESTAWFDTSFLQLVGEVEVAPYDEDDS